MENTANTKAIDEETNKLVKSSGGIPFTSTKPLAVKEKEDDWASPRKFSNLIYIRRKKSSGQLPREGEVLDETIAKIGSGLRNQGVLRGLNTEEQKRWLPDIINISPDSQNWEAAVKDYWTNISKDVPPSDKEGNGGLKLEVGLEYDNKDDYEYDQKKVKTWGDVETEGVKQKVTIENPKGRPININDYILWRYCLVYSRVANSIEDVGKAPYIEFYIFSKEKEIKDQKVSFENKKKASQLMYQRIGDREWVEYMLRLFIKDDKSPLYSIKELASISPDEKDVLLSKYMDKNPILFTIYGEDKNLELKAFIEFAIATGVLNRIPNTSAISFEGQTIGNNLEETVIFLNNPRNADSLGRIKAQSRVIA